MSTNYTKKDRIANQIIKDVREYIIKYGKAISLRILGAKYGRAIKPYMDFCELMNELERAQLVYMDFTEKGSRLVYPTQPKEEDWL